MISNKALPGDSFYPVKIAVEKITSLIFSPSYQARSDLEIKLIQRRIEENQSLILSSGSTQGLALLVAQAESAKQYILESKTSPQTRTQSVQKLVNTLQKSKQSLEEEKRIISVNPQTSSVKPSTNPTPTPTSNPSISNGNSPAAPALTPTSLPSDSLDPIADIENTQDQLDEIIDQLEKSDQNYSESFSAPPTIITPESTPLPTQEPLPTETPGNRGNSPRNFIAPPSSETNDSSPEPVDDNNDSAESQGNSGDPTESTTITE